MSRPDKLTEAISRLNDAEHQLTYAAQSAGNGNLRTHLKDIQQDVRQARMRIEEHRDGNGGADQD